MSKSAVVFNIQHFCIHDGPGIRTTVFFKGCPLRCQWCHNPESNLAVPQLMFHRHLCQGCGRCIAVCPEDCITFNEEDKKVDINFSKCTACGRCADYVCENKARSIAGENMDLETLYHEAMEDNNFFKSSKGGVTFSGGEPFVHYEIIEELAEKLHEQGVHMAAETCGYWNWNKLEKTLRNIDLFLFDIKKMDEEKHKELTGVSNKIILENLKNIAQKLNKKIWIRMPLISEVNDTEADIRKTIDFVLPFKDNIERVCLLPYHNLGLSKLESIGWDCSTMEKFSAPTEEHLSVLKETWIKNGFEVY